MPSSAPLQTLKKRRVLAVSLASALLCLAAEAGVSPMPGRILAPRFDAVATSPEPAVLDVDQVINDAAREHGVSRHLIRAIIETESDFDSLAVSPRGACGLMQLMPATVRRFGVADCFDARENVAAGTRYLKVLLTRYDGSIALSAAAYNAGEGAVARHRGVPPYPQTRAYVRRVKALLPRT
jgi:soluble lytic murein transglycosylase-like protein